MQLNGSDLSALTIEFYRQHAADDDHIRTAIAMQMLNNAFRHIAQRRNKGSSQARHLLREAAARVMLAESEELERMLRLFGGNESVSSRQCRVPFSLKTKYGN